MVSACCLVCEEWEKGQNYWERQENTRMTKQKKVFLLFFPFACCVAFSQSVRFFDPVLSNGLTTDWHLDGAVPHLRSPTLPLRLLAYSSGLLHVTWWDVSASTARSKDNKDALQAHIYHPQASAFPSTRHWYRSIERETWMYNTQTQNWFSFRSYINIEKVLRSKFEFNWGHCLACIYQESQTCYSFVIYLF